MMFSGRVGQLAQQRAQLIARSALQRDTLRNDLSMLHTPAATFDRVFAATRFLRAHPLAVAAAAGVLALLGRRQLLRWTGRALVVWRGWQTLRTLLRTRAA